MTNLTAVTHAALEPISSHYAAPILDSPKMAASVKQAEYSQPFERLMMDRAPETGHMAKASSGSSQAMTNFYLDNNALAKLKHDNSASGLLAASQQFEALFLQQMLTRMRSASQALSDKDNPLSMKSDDMFQGMLDAQLAQRISRQSSFGLAEMISKQLSSQVMGRPFDKENQ
ncbi:rod-binding protein [Vibrio chagasii]|uniref:rod-binding protein n=1 Tax=Vibrio chagasii TaxID=170679 RepID=UPI0038CD826C